MSRLVVVSNRVADLRNPARAGGLAVGLSDALGERKGMWFGWDGKMVAPRTRVPPEIITVDGIKTVTLPLARKDYAEYYAGFSNSVLWPLFHYRLDLVEYQPNFLKGYKKVNSKFASALSPLLQPRDTIWVHDYHLIPLAAELRKRRHRQRIGFFLHIPFPPPDILIAAPKHDWLVRCFFDYDLVGFQTQSDLGNFQRYVVEQMNGFVGDDGVMMIDGRELRAGCFPIGIDVSTFAEMGRTPEAEEQIEVIRQRTLARRRIIGVDRLDYSKGLPERLQAYWRLLETHPDIAKTVTYMQIASPTREDVEAYGDIRLQLEALSGAINGRFGDFDWTPLRYIHRSVPRTTLAALFRSSNVGFVSPLRDGMNLVAKEFVAAQDANDPGVLVLSKFAGAAEELKEALIVNPYDIDEMAENLLQALTMPLAERVVRHGALLRRINAHDARVWQTDFLAALDP